MAKIRMPIARDMKISAFSGGTVTEYSSYMQNAMVEREVSDESDLLIVTQRPSIDMIEDASDTVSKIKGRGIHYWDTTSADYFINDDTVYKDVYSAALGTISTGTRKCTFHEVGTRLIIVDPENNEVWTITTAGTLAKVTDVDLPSTITGGAAVLDGYLFIMDDGGIIYHSDLDDATSWNPLNFITAEREPDSGTYLGRHFDHIVAFGKSTVEFFYNAGNATGSVLSRRQDIFYNIGAPYEDGVWEDGDDVFFLGRSKRGDFSVYTISNFRLKKISNAEFSSYLTSSYAENSFFPLMAGFSARGHTFISITLHTTLGSIVPTETFVYDIENQIWSPWTSDMVELSSTAGFPVIDWTTSTSSRFGTGILTNGDLITLKNTFNPEDSYTSKYYIVNESDYVNPDYIAPFGSGLGTNIPMVCRMGHLDSGTHSYKFGSFLEVIHDHTHTPQTLTVKWSDGDYNTFSSTRTVDTSLKTRLSRIGKYHRRVYQLEYSGSDTLRLSSIDFIVRESSI